jgi:hypothetical protein
VITSMENGSPYPDAADAILRYAFFWYNFMPLARGTAVVGYITILSMFLAAGMPVQSSIPKARFCSDSCCCNFHLSSKYLRKCNVQGVQTDWEAILAHSAEEFIGNVSPWLYPAVAQGAVKTDASDPLDGLPDLSKTLITARHRLEALNGSELKPLPFS